MSRHTAGPWVLDAWGDIRAGHNTVICAMGKSSGFKSDYTTPAKAETAANAKLITAATDMLEALKGVLRVADRATVEFDAARAAVAKAEGG